MSKTDETDLRSGKKHRRWFNVSPLGGNLNELAWFMGSQSSPPSGEPLKFLNVSKQLWRNEASFTEITWLWQFDTHSEPLFRNNWFTIVELKQCFESAHHYMGENTTKQVHIPDSQWFNRNLQSYENTFCVQRKQK